MASLIEDLGTKPFSFPKQNNQSIPVTPEAHYALSKVAERLLSTGMKTKESRWQEKFDLCPLDDTFREDPAKLTPEQRAKLDAGKADLCLVALHKGILRVMSHLQFEAYWNVIGEKERASTHLVRDYWLGYGFDLDLRTVRDIDGINLKISHRLIKDISDMAKHVQEWKECEREGRELPRQMKRLKVKKETYEIDKGTWVDRVYLDWSQVGMDKSTYLHTVVMALADGQEIPSSVPPTVLNQFERDELAKLFTKKLTDNKPKKEAA